MVWIAGPVPIFDRPEKMGQPHLVDLKSRRVDRTLVTVKFEFSCLMWNSLINCWLGLLTSDIPQTHPSTPARYEVTLLKDGEGQR